MRIVALILAAAALAVGGFAVYDAEHLRHQLNDRLAVARDALARLDQRLQRARTDAEVSTAVCRDWGAYTASLKLLNGSTVYQWQVEQARDQVRRMAGNLAGLTGISAVSGWHSDLERTYGDLVQADQGFSQAPNPDPTLGKAEQDMQMLHEDAAYAGVKC